MQNNKSDTMRFNSSNQPMIQSHEILNPSYFQNPLQMSQQWPNGWQNNENQFPQSQQSPQKEIFPHKLLSDQQFTNHSASSMSNVQVVRKIVPSDSKLDQSVVESNRSVSNYKPAFVNYPPPMFVFHPPVRQLQFGNSELEKRYILEMALITGENTQLKLEKQQQIYSQNQKDELIGQLEQQILDLQKHLEEEEGEIVTTTTQVHTFEEEAKVWKQKFIELNDKYHACQEKLQIRDAEYEQLINSQNSQKIIEQGSKIRKNDPNDLKKSLGINEIQKP